MSTFTLTGEHGCERQQTGVGECPAYARLRAALAEKERVAEAWKAAAEAWERSSVIAEAGQFPELLESIIEARRLTAAARELKAQGEQNG